MIKVELLGEIGKKFGSSHLLDIKSPAEAIRALTANFKEFRQYMENSDKNGVAYRVLVNESDIDLDELENPASKSIKIVPVIMGAGGVGKFLLGTALVLTAIFAPFAAVPLFAGATIGSVVGSIGVSLVIGGVAEMISPVPKTPDYNDTSEERSPSYLFNGAVNTTSQGHPVPIGYGRLIIGSAVVSAGTDAVNIKA